MNQHQTAAAMTNAWSGQQDCDFFLLAGAPPTDGPIMEAGWRAGQRWAEQHPTEAVDLGIITQEAARSRAERFPAAIPHLVEGAEAIWECAWRAGAMATVDIQHQRAARSRSAGAFDPLDAWCKDVCGVVDSTYSLSFSAEGYDHYVVSLFFHGRRFQRLATVPKGTPSPTAVQVLEDLLAEAAEGEGVSFEEGVASREGSADRDDAGPDDERWALCRDLETWLGEEYPHAVALMRQRQEQRRSEGKGRALRIPGVRYTSLDNWWQEEMACL